MAYNKENYVVLINVMFLILQYCTDIGSIANTIFSTANVLKNLVLALVLAIL